MVKKKQIKKNKTSYWIIGLLILLISISIFTYIKMPKRHCHIETHTEKIEVECVLGGYPTHDNMVCEDGVDGDVKNDYGGNIWYCGDGNKLCMYEVEEEVCVIE